MKHELWEFAGTNGELKNQRQLRLEWLDSLKIVELEFHVEEEMGNEWSELQ